MDKIKTYQIPKGDPVLMVQEAASIYFKTFSIIDSRPYISQLSDTVSLNDDIIADWLNITPRTYRNYKSKSTDLKPNMKEHIVMLLALYDHGSDVFEDTSTFEKWLSTPNLLLDQRAPLSYLNTINGIRLIDDRLTALEYGENV